jgi:hypothetical protein
MRHGRLTTIACLLSFAGILQAQERVPLPPPDPAPAEASLPPPPAPTPQIQQPPEGPPQVSPSAPYPPSPTPFYAPLRVYGPYPPPPGAYVAPAPYSPPVVVGDPAGNPCFWIGVDALIWWTKNQPLPVPVVTTGPASQGANAGNLGAPGTTSLVQEFDSGVVGGARLFLGGWFDTDHTIGMDGSLFILGRQSTSFSVFDRSGIGNFVINEPVASAPFITQVSAPGAETGSVVVGATTQFGGGDVNVLYNLLRAHGWSLNLLGGYRYLELEETLGIVANSTLFTTTIYIDNMGNVLATAPPGSSVTVIDEFRTKNQFNGGQVGVEAQYLWNRVVFGGAAKLAIGDTHEEITVNGTTRVFPVNGNPVSLIGGNFASLQIGRYTSDHFALAPELQLNVGYQFTPCLRGLIGYDFLYLSSVARPGNQIDNTYDGATHPTVPMASSSFWAQGLNLSLQFSF